MSGSFTVDGSNVTIGFEWTTTVAKAQTTVDAAAHMLYDRNPPTESVDTGEVDENGDPIFTETVVAWEYMTNAQKLELLDKYILASVRKLAVGYLFDVRQEAMEEAAQTDSETVL